MTTHILTPTMLNLDSVWGPMRLDQTNSALTSNALQADLDECSADVLSAHGIRVEQDCGVGGLTVAAVIGFTGAGLAGALGIATTDEALGALYARSYGQDGDSAALSDWLRELSNQVLGRIKGRLLARGYSVYLSLPQSVRGMSLVPSESRRHRIAWTVLSCDAGVVLVWLDLEISAALSEGPGKAIDASASGDVIIF